MLLYALRDYREWAIRLATPALVPLAVQCFDLLSSPGRKKISKWLSRLGDGELIEVLRRQAVPACVGLCPEPRAGGVRNLAPDEILTASTVLVCLLCAPF